MSTYYLILARITDTNLFTQYMKGHLPTIAQYGGQLVFRSIQNTPVLGTENWDAIAIQKWPDEAAFVKWWQSDKYRPWAEIRDQAARILIICCQDAVLL
ncbi:MAG: DUF1330 domain-containing protein [Candidatus Accumulibacter sp.]|jgi:uncharacterized protein (DUF1330 family)|nr:DUF1330 domain-containing protein [Accumulibacter sp.]